MAGKNAAKTRQRHGLTTLKGRLKVAGMNTVDHRSAAFRTLKTWRQQLECDLGGRESLSAQQLAIIETVCSTRFLLSACDAFLLQVHPINRRGRSLFPIARQRQTLADSLLRQLQALGLRKIAKDCSIPPEWVEHVQPYAPEPEPEGQGDEGDHASEPANAGNGHAAEASR